MKSVKMGGEQGITTQQAAVFVGNFILGVGILTLPRQAAEKVQTPDIWLSVILGGLLAMLAGIILVKLGEYFPGRTFYEYSESIVGKWLSPILNLAVIAYFIATSGHVVRSLAEVTVLFLLEGTPRWAIILSFMWVGLYLILGGLSAIGRLFAIIFPITVIIFVVIAAMSFKIFDLGNLRPVLGLGIMPVLKGVRTTGLSFTGYEIMLILQAYMLRPRQAAHAVVFGVSIPLLFYVTTVVMVIGALSVEGVISRAWPMITLIRSFEFPGIFFERYESLMLVIWIMQIFATYVITHYAAAQGLAIMFNTELRRFQYAMIPIVFIVAMLPKNINDLFQFANTIGNTGIVLFGALPVVLLGIVKLRGVRNGQKT
ncbi:MAG: spore germination protein [Paenibacillus dendritiformis]|uniref:spore germination protein n=1 Tax=uncultured Paenibacillus sp. TaxID=227322 RepID=UPI0025EA1093|nr:spore germination protein [uncultured Paenibacillus sp.]MDU5140952.1 spore germination protein [Paenibacillus dendritiformis]